MKNYVFSYQMSNRLEVIGYSDLDFARCFDSRKSMFDYLFLFGWGAISWKFGKWFITVSSTMEAKFVVCIEAIIHVWWLLSFISRFGIVDSIVRPLKIRCDNFAIIFFFKIDKYYESAKYMELKYFVVKQEVHKQNMSIKHRSSNEMIITKGI